MIGFDSAPRQFDRLSAIRRPRRPACTPIHASRGAADELIAPIVDSRAVLHVIANRTALLAGQSGPVGMRYSTLVCHAISEPVQGRLIGRRGVMRTLRTTRSADYGGFGFASNNDESPLGDHIKLKTLRSAPAREWQR
jgi:hypothetical protein